MDRKGFAWMIVLLIVAVILLVGWAVWYTVAHKASSLPAPIAPLAPNVGTSTQPLGVTSSTVATSTLATTSPLSYPPLLFGPFVAATSTVFVLVESSTAPLQSLLADPRFPAGLASDSFVKVNVLAFAVATGSSYSGWSRFNTKEFDVVGAATYLNTFGLVPGDVVALDLGGCSLYQGWPNFTCISRVIPLQHAGGIPGGTLPTWAGQNGATITLNDASIDTLPSTTSSILSVSVNIMSGYGEFCPTFLSNYGLAIVKDEYGHLIHPLLTIDSSTDSCIGPNATTSQELFWNSLPTSTPIVVGAFDVNGNQQTFFSIYPLPDQAVYIEPAPQQ